MRLNLIKLVDGEDISLDIVETNASEDKMMETEFMGYPAVIAHEAHGVFTLEDWDKDSATYILCSAASVAGGRLTKISPVASEPTTLSA